MQGLSALFPGGDAAFRIGLRPVSEEAWLEPGAPDPERKARLLARRPRAVWGELDGSRPGQAEALAMVAGARGEPSAGDDPATPPLWAAGLRVADDLCLMERRAGAWTLTAASLCSPSFFTAEQAVGRDLRGLHGPVPGFEALLLSRVERIFDALRPGLILERRNWSVTPSGDLFLPDAAPVRAAWEALSPGEALAALHVRMERQTLRRLPETDAVLFTIRIHRHSLTELAACPASLAAFAQAWRAAMGGEGEPFRRYKGLALYDGAVPRFLAQAGEGSPGGRKGVTDAAA